MITELRKIQDTLHRAPNCYENADYFYQVLYLQGSIKPKEIALSGAGFLSLKRSLFVSFVDSVVPSKALGVFVKSICFVGDFFFYVHDIAPSLIIRPCAEVFRLYIAHQHKLLRSIVGPSVADVNFTDRVTMLQTIRLNLSRIVALKGRLDDVLGWSIMASVINFMFYSCVTVYIPFVETFSTDHHLLLVMYTISSCLDFIDVTDLSHGMISELRNLRQTLQRVPTSGETLAHFNQVIYLHRSIKPKKIAFSGSNFFWLNRPLVVSVCYSESFSQDKTNCIDVWMHDHLPTPHEQM
ncbi:hypothetical protein V5799_020812 [Amblyomma americanum]|uniref:Gustatory receptor n=1 Tax=Amblyomma americanum TaxID=6943 RepID=A0AAQ4ETB8_AMBAM